MTGPAADTATGPAATTAGTEVTFDNVADVIAAKKKRTSSVQVVLDEETGDYITFRFAAPGRLEMRDLRLAPDCKPTKEQQAEHRRLQLDNHVPPSRLDHLDVNPLVFWPRLLSTACVSHQWSEEQWSEFLESDVLNDPEYQALIYAATAAVSTRAKVDPDPEG